MQNLAAMAPKAGLLLAPMGNNPIAMVDARDVAACAVAALLAVRMAAYFASGADGAPTDAVRRLTGRAPRTVQQFLDEKAS